MVIESLQDVQPALALAGGKGVNLGRLLRAGLPVPDGFVLTTDAYRAFVEANALQAWIEARAAAVDEHELEAVSSAIRERFAAGTIPAELARVIAAAYASLGGDGGGRTAVAVRSSATAEDLPHLSFAGQQDSFLNVTGREALLEAVVACWSSLWTARAIGYRQRSGIDQGSVALAVVVQRMVEAESAGVLFTANPLNGRRDQTVIDATFGLGEALVAGQVEPDQYVVDTAAGKIVEKRLGGKALLIRGKAGGGTETVANENASRQALPDAAVVSLTALGEQAQKLLGAPQDVEWAWSAGKLWIVQSRPITTLFPIPRALDGTTAAEPKIWFSFAAVQGIMGPLTPLGRDVIGGVMAGGARLFGYETTFDRQRVAWEAGERLWMNLTPLLRNGMGRRVMLAALRFIEPDTAAILQTLADDPRVTPLADRPSPATMRRLARFAVPVVARLLRVLRQPERGRQRLEATTADMLQRFSRRAQNAHTLADRARLLEDMLRAGFPTILPRFLPVMAGGMGSLTLLNLLASRAGLPDAMGVTRGLPHNVTTEMDLALWAAAQQIGGDAAAANLLQAGSAEDLAAAYVAGQLPPAAQGAIAAFLERYGMRGIGEIDLGRPRWREQPAPVIETLQSYLQIDKARAPDVVFARGAREAAVTVVELEQALRRKPLGRLPARLVRPAARRVRALAGQRETPKFIIIQLMGLARAGLLESGATLAAQGVIAQAEDLFFLRLPELRALARGEQRPWRELAAARRESYEREQRRRQVPRVILSDGQTFFEGGIAVDGAGSAADGVLRGSPVSNGVVEGPVRVVLSPHASRLAPGEILVCPGTDPAWTPLFLTAGGLVMEVGGLMTHGSVVAREYGIPAVVGVNGATAKLATGSRVRVDGNQGTVTLLERSDRSGDAQ